jgi:hypothetical protein
VTGDFEVVPRTKGVLVMEEGIENIAKDEDKEDWPSLARETEVVVKSVDERASYAQVTKAVFLPTSL